MRAGRVYGPYPVTAVKLAERCRFPVSWGISCRRARSLCIPMTGDTPVGRRVAVRPGDQSGW
jgi:hypothetical protein